MTLGLDASTSTVGWAFSEDGKIVSAGFLDISNLETSKEKSLFVLDYLRSTPLLKDVTEINLEAALSGFAGGRTSQQVIIKLARFNAVFEYIISEETELKVNLCNDQHHEKTVVWKSKSQGHEGQGIC